jgi:hypothetical protein
MATAETQPPEAFSGCPTGYWKVRTLELSESGGNIDLQSLDQGFFFALVYRRTD